MCTKIQPVHPKGDQSWVFIGRTDVEAETPIFWPPHVESWLILKDPGAGKDWRQEEKGTTEDEMVGWHHWLDGHGFGWTLGVGDGQGGLACCSSWVRKELDMTERLNWNELIVSNFSRNRSNVFQSSCTILHSHQQFIRVPVSLHFTSTFLFLIIVIPVDMGVPGDSHGKESTYNTGDLGLISGLGRSPRGGHGNPLKCSYLENPHEQRNLAGYSPWGHKESDTTEWLSRS